MRLKAFESILLVPCHKKSRIPKRINIPFCPITCFIIQTKMSTLATDKMPIADQTGASKIASQPSSGDDKEDGSSDPVPAQGPVAMISTRNLIVSRENSVSLKVGGGDRNINVAGSDDDDDDVKKRRRRSSLLRRSLSSSCLNKPSQGGRPLIAPAPELLAEAALEDKKKKTRNISIIKAELANIDFSNFDEGDEDDNNDISTSEQSNKKILTEDSDTVAKGDEIATLSTASVKKSNLEQEPVVDEKEKEVDGLGELQSMSKVKWSASERDDNDSVTSSGTGASRRGMLKRAGSYASRGTVSIHHVVNPLDVTVKVVKSKNPGPDGKFFDIYELLPNHTGNNRVGVMVDLQIDMFLTQVEQEKKQQAFIQTSETPLSKGGTTLRNSKKLDSRTKRITNRVCQEVVRTVQEYWQGRFLVQVEEDGDIGYKLLMHHEALQAVFDIFQQVAEADNRNREVDLPKQSQSALPTTTPVISNKPATILNTSVTSTTSYGSSTRSRSPSDSSLSIVTYGGHDDGMSVTSHTTKNTIKSSSNSIRSVVPPEFPEGEDVHKSALASLQRRKMRQYATTKISNLVTGRGLIQKDATFPANQPTALSDMSADRNTKKVPRQKSAPVGGSDATFSSLPTTVAQPSNQRQRSSSSGLIGSNEKQEAGSNLAANEEDRGESTMARRKSEQPMMMQAAVRRSLARNQLQGIHEDGAFDADSTNSERLQTQSLPDKKIVTSDFRRSSTSAAALDLSCPEVKDAFNSVEDEDLEPYQTAHQPHEMSAALQQFQELFSSNVPAGLHDQPGQQQLQPNFQGGTLASVPPYGFESNNQIQIGGIPITNPSDAVTAAFLLQNENMLLQQQLQQQQQLLQHRQVFNQSLTGSANASQFHPYGSRVGSGLYQGGDDYGGYDNTRAQAGVAAGAAATTASSIRFEEPSQMHRRRQSSIMGRRSTRLSEFSQAMIQDLLNRLHESGELNDDDDYY
jgi:hypothetical protein